MIQPKQHTAANVFFSILFSFKSNCELSCCKTPDGKEIVRHHLFFICITVILSFSLGTGTWKFQASDVVTSILCWRLRICLQMNHRNVHFLIINSSFSCNVLFCFTYRLAALVLISSLSWWVTFPSEVLKITTIKLIMPNSCHGLQRGGKNLTVSWKK